jgi:hypothetical protein
MSKTPRMTVIKELALLRAFFEVCSTCVCQPFVRKAAHRSNQLGSKGSLFSSTALSFELLADHVFVSRRDLLGTPTRFA